MMEDRVRALRTANIYEPHAYRHLLGRPRFERTGDGFDVRSNFCVYRIAQDGDTVTFATGRYLDRIVDDGGALRFHGAARCAGFAAGGYPVGSAAVTAAAYVGMKLSQAGLEPGGRRIAALPRALR